MSAKLPLVVILGATGSGKTKLSLELAKKFGGEILGADSMQVYKGLEIITAKATETEQAVAPHHMIDILEPHEIFTVVDYRNMALKIIDRLFTQNKLPIIVGGTNYYIESLLWKILIEDSDKRFKVPPHLSVTDDHLLASGELYEKLKKLDGDMARRLHPNNKRKILRSLEVLHQKGRKHSELLAEQQESTGGNKTGGGLRFDSALIFRLQCKREVLDERLNDRVDQMIEQGLVEELLQFHKTYNGSNGSPPDYTKGVFQSIGFKEFHPYLIMGEEERSSEKGAQIFAKCVEELKIVTRRYARKQNKWTDNRFLGRRDREVPAMYGLDVTNPDQWKGEVLIPAIKIVENYMDPLLRHDIDRYRLEALDSSNSFPNSEDNTYRCDLCERVFVGSYQWNIHLSSNRHKRTKERINRQRQAESSQHEVLSNDIMS